MWDTGLKTLPDPCAAVDSRDVGKTVAESSYYGVTWGSEGDGTCVEDGVGRFPEMDQTMDVTDMARRSTIVENLYALDPAEGGGTTTTSVISGTVTIQ